MSSDSEERESSLRRAMQRLVHSMDIVDRYVLMPLAVGAMLILTVLVATDAVFRYIQGSSIPHLSQFTGLILMPMAVFLVVGYLASIRGNIAIDVLTAKYNHRVTMGLECLFDLLTGTFFAVIASQFFSRGIDSIGGRTTTFEIPPQYTFFIIAVGAAWGCLRFVVSAGTDVLGLTRNSMVDEDSVTVDTA